MGAQPGLELALPLGVLDFQGVQRGEQRFGLSPGMSDARPAADIVVGRRRRPFSSLETFEAGQDSESATCRPVSPARRRNSRSRWPSAWRAS